jgi:hypothetical protein
MPHQKINQARPGGHPLGGAAPPPNHLRDPDADAPRREHLPRGGVIGKAAAPDSTATAAASDATTATITTTAGSAAGTDAATAARGEEIPSRLLTVEPTPAEASASDGHSAPLSGGKPRPCDDLPCPDHAVCAASADGAQCIATCVEGFVPIDGRCARDPCAGVACPARGECAPTNAGCVLTCGDGFEPRKGNGRAECLPVLGLGD